MTKLYILSTYHPAWADAVDEREVCLDAQMPFLSPERAKASAQATEASFADGSDSPDLAWNFHASGPAKAESSPYGYTGKVWEASAPTSGTEYRITEVIAG